MTVNEIQCTFQLHNGLFIHAFVLFLPLVAVFYVTSNRAASTVRMGILARITGLKYI